MKKLCPLFITAFLLLWLTACHKAKPAVSAPDGTGIVRSDDISNQQINCFGEDAFGYMWVGTMRGVNKYNGYSFLQYYHTDEAASLSNNQVMRIFNDSRGRLWFGTRYGINYLNRQGIISRATINDINRNVLNIREAGGKRIFINTSTTIYEFDEEQDTFTGRIHLPDSLQATVGFFIDKGNRFWTVGYRGIQSYDGSAFRLISSHPFEMENVWIHYAFLRNNGELWLGVGNRLLIFDTKSGVYVPVPPSYRSHHVLSTAIITLIHPYDDASLLINTQKDGLFLLNTFTGEVIHQSENGFPFKVPDTEITALYTDSNKNLWIGSYDQGFFVRYNYQQRFNANDYLRTQTEHKSIMSVATDKEQNLWIATRTHGLMLWDKESRRINTIGLKSIFTDAQFYRDKVNALFIDSKNRIWLQTDGKLICCRYQNKKLVPEQTFFLYVNINIMTEDYEGNIWAAGANENLYVLKKGAGAFEAIRLYSTGFMFTNGLIRLSGGKLLVASFMQNLQLIDPVTRLIEEIEILPYMGKSLFIPAALFEDARGDVWIATIGAGLFRYSQQTGQVEKIEGVSCNEISSLTEDVQGNIWAGTLYGLCKYDRTTGRFTCYYANDGTGGNQFNERSVCRLSDNLLVFGGTHGLTVFDPVDVSVRRQIPLYLEELKVHNRLVNPTEGGNMETALLLNPGIRLAYNENNIQLSYIALDYSEYPRVQYAYKLEGFDNQWVEADNYRQAFYSNLPPGHYTFRVKFTSHDNTVTETVTSIPVHVARAPWFSLPALCLYAVLLMGFVLSVIYVYLHFKANREKTRQAIREKEQEKYLNQMNTRFFSNMSHEFRTPLTMISGPINTLCKDELITGENKRLLYIVRRSVSRMLSLVNQLMDFNKLDNGALYLHVQNTDIISELDSITEIYKVNVKEKNIKLNTYGLEDVFITWVDTDKLYKIVSNLLANALKYSPEGATIDVTFDVIPGKDATALYTHTNISRDGDYVKISIDDTGPGIPADKLETIFRRYYQLDKDANAHRNLGTGIGLYFARRLAEMHHGALFASERGKGASFTLLLPVNEQAYSAKEKEEAKKEQPFLLREPESSVADEPAKTVEETPEATLLVVDDDTGISRYLRELLSASFRVVNRYDAESAWSSIEELSPDLILSDVLMPGTDGYAFCKRIKENLSTCHIPVILLTAKVNVDDQVEGLNVGANAYVTKPFDPSYLTALLKSQLRNRDMTRRLLTDTTQAGTLSEEILTSQDKAFMDSLYTLMENELSNPDLNITRMTEVLHISRTKFYYKVKGLTGENPNIFFKTYKLNRAAELIKAGAYTMSEIADMTGFSTPSHFSASFKKKFGVSPGNY
jgi:signal transduction histidine kinase/ligand-binding sensor domain-containing protein/DNA-binding response OmpR family regulator